MDKVVLGKRVREARKQKNLTQEALAEIVGVSTMFLGEVERGVKLPSLAVLIMIIEALDISADYLLRGEVSSGNDFINNEIASKLEKLTPKQRITALSILDAYIENL